MPHRLHTIPQVCVTGLLLTTALAGETRTVPVFAEDRIAVAVAGLAALPDDQVHDAYDADRDGRFLRITATFRHAGSGEELRFPGFVRRDRPLGPWRGEVRWQPVRAGLWQVAVEVRCASDPAAPLEVQRHAVEPILALASSTRRGPLLDPEPGGRLLRERTADGGARAVWLFGACRAWQVASNPAAAGWAGHEGYDRLGWLLPLLRGHGFDLLNQWFAPWEFLPVHRDRAEWWPGADGRWQRHAIPAERAWSAWSAFDQGRCASIDAWAEACAGDGTRPVRWLLSPLPHQCLQLRSHEWGAHESGWSPEDDGGRQAPEKLNGFSALVPNGTPWDFLAADPRDPVGDPRRAMFDHQANYWRYCIARWGSSPALGVWVVIDELDAVGDRVGSIALKRGWWEHPDRDRWLADTFALFRGELARSGHDDRYDGDPLRHPLHAATTSAGGMLTPGANLEWDGGRSPPGLLGWHWYPQWSEPLTWHGLWDLTVQGIERFALAGGGARLISEAGFPERSGPDQSPALFQPTAHHVAAWAAIFAGLAGTTMTWHDGKEFGELRWRDEGDGPFARRSYPIDLVAHNARLRAFLGDSDPGRYVPARGAAPVVCAGRAGTRAYALWSQADGVLAGWMLAAGDETARCTVRGLAPGTWTLTWGDPWPGGSDAVAVEQVVATADGLELDAGAHIRAMHRSAPAHALGAGDRRDACFRLRRTPPTP